MNFRKEILKEFDFWLLMSILFLMPIAGMFRLAGKPVQISDILFLIYFLIWLFKRIAFKNFKVSAKFYLFCGLFIIFCLSTCFSPFPMKSTMGLVIKIYLLMLAYIISEEINSLFRFKLAINAILLSGIYVIALSFWGMLSFVRGCPSIFLCPSNILDLPVQYFFFAKFSFLILNDSNTTFIRENFTPYRFVI